MYSYEDRVRAVALYLKYGGKTATVIRELGYPSRKNLKRWVRLYQAAGDLPKRYRARPRYTAEQKRVAVDHYFAHGCCLANAGRALGYPSRNVPASWVEDRTDKIRPRHQLPGPDKQGEDTGG